MKSLIISYLFVSLILWSCKFEEDRNFIKITLFNCKGKTYRINKISETYEDVKVGDALAMFNGFGYLEIALNGKSAYKMLYPREVGRSFDFNLIIEFND